LKLCQFSASSAEFWLTTVFKPFCAIEPEPPTTTPPIGVLPGATPPATAASAPPQNDTEPSATARLSASRCCRSRGRAIADDRRDVRRVVREVVFMVVVRQSLFMTPKRPAPESVCAQAKEERRSGRRSTTV